MTPGQRAEHWLGEMSQAAQWLNNDVFGRAFACWLATMNERPCLEPERVALEELTLRHASGDLMATTLWKATEITADYFGKDHLQRCWKPTREDVEWW